MKCFVATIAVLACVSMVRAEPPLPQNQYLPPNQQAQQPQPSSNYLPPTQTYQSPSSNYLPPQRTPAQQPQPQQPTNTYQAPSSSYGAPAITSAIFPQKSTAQLGGYSGGNTNNAGYGSGYGNEEQYGPAKYEFKYDVQDYESGNDFGHMEQRDGDLAVGRYYVLLPDGRKQIVDYEADSNGYRPTIRYEQVNNGANGRNGYNNAGGYDSNAQGKGFGGYQ